MNQYTQLIGFTRVPQHGCDRLVHVPFPSPSKHIVLIIEDQFFKIDVYAKNGNRLLDGDLERYKRSIVFYIFVMFDRFWGNLSNGHTRCGHFDMLKNRRFRQLSSSFNLFGPHIHIRIP